MPGSSVANDRHWSLGPDNRTVPIAEKAAGGVVAKLRADGLSTRRAPAESRDGRCGASDSVAFTIGNKSDIGVGPDWRRAPQPKHREPSMFDLMLCCMMVPDYLFRCYVQGKLIGREVTLNSMLYEREALPCNRNPEFQPLRARGRRNRRNQGRPWQSFAGVVLLATLSAVVAMPAFAQMSVGPILPAPEIGARKIFLMLFLMLGPIKILVPFVEMTHGSDPAFRRRLATRAILFSAAALALAGGLGRGMLENFDISLPVLALTGGVILFLVALRTVLQQSTGAVERLKRGPPTARTEACAHAPGLPHYRHPIWNCSSDRVRDTGGRQI